MNFQTFASFIIFVVFLIWLQYEIKKHTKYDEKKRKEYWDKERKANTTRKKSLENLSYITIPLDSFPLHLLKEDEQMQEYHEILHSLNEEKIVNFTGISNTDLKLEYGVANLPLLMHYDQCYTNLVRTLQDFAQKLYDNGYEKECIPVLEFAVETGTDVSGTYKLLAGIYQNNNDAEKLEHLKTKAETLNSAMKNPIVRMLKEFDL